MSVCHTGTTPMGEWRIIDKGTTNVPNGIETPLGSPFTPTAGEFLMWGAFVSTPPAADRDVGLCFAPAGSDVGVRMLALSAGGQQLTCLTQVSEALDVSWIIIGITPPP